MEHNKANHIKDGNPSEEPPAKKMKLEETSEVEEEDMAFGFNNPVYSNHKIIIKQDQDGEEKEELVHVDKLNCSAASPWFKKRMVAESETEIVLDRNHTIEHMKDLLRWMYAHDFQSEGPDLVSVMSLAHKYQVDKAIRHCSQKLSNVMTIEHACSYLAQEATMREEGEIPPGFSALWKEASNFLQKEFHELNIETITSERFLNLPVHGVRAILSSETVHIGTENTIFTAYRTWIHRDFETRKHHAKILLPHIRFTQVRSDFLLDVVKKEGELMYPDDAKKLFAKKIIESYVHHSTSPERREALKLQTEVARSYDQRLLKQTFSWKIDNFADLKEVWSQPFFLGGYFLHLLMQRKNPNGPGGGTIGLYLHIKVDAGLAPDFFAPLAFELLVKNVRTGKFMSPKGAYSSPFTAQNKAWGYVDILTTTWEEFHKESIYNDRGSLEVKAHVWFKDYWDKIKK